MPTSQNSDRTVDARPQGHESQTDPESPQQPVRQTPVPKLQLLTVCVSRIAEPFAYTQIFPYVNQMVWDLGVTDDPKKVGFYSGMIDSSFAFAQVLTVYSYGALSDRIGRKPVVLMGTFGVALSAALFGLSSSFTHMMAARMVAGLLSGYIAVLHSILGEITDDTNQAAGMQLSISSRCQSLSLLSVAYPIYALCYPIGSFIGPLVGGALANPNESIPHLVPAFLHGLFDKYPYMLPSMAACTVAAMSFAFVFIFLEETLPSMVRRKARKRSGASTPTSLYGARGRTLERTGQYSGSEQSAESSSSASPSTEHSRYSSASTRVGEDELPKKCPSETDALLATADDEDEDEQPHNWTVRELLKLPELRQLYRSSMILSFIAESYVVVFVLFAYTKIQYGGLGFEPAEIGFVLATAGGISFALQILVLPVILRRAKPTKTFEACMMLWPIGFAIPPILNIIARTASENGKHPIGPAASAAIWVGIWGAQLITKLACMGYAMNMVIARQSAPDQRALGTTNGLNQLFMCIARMFAPAAVSTIFALSSENNWLGGHLVWVIMIILSLLGWKASVWK
ncbi:Major Facilitator Superfamily [Rhizoctonia solani]|uniref:Major Facilitator Superfamily n=1 Tax=Rhizoctonia solani TaxID=456999 RepID=A0A8H7H3W9_9AGAM|nr:Major Facilitator Superfamily [Rhizoctonia solani]